MRNGKHANISVGRVHWRASVLYWILYQCRRVGPIRRAWDSYFRFRYARRVRVVSPEALSPWLVIGSLALLTSWLTSCVSIVLLTLTTHSP